MKPGAGQRKDQATRPAQLPRTPPQSAGGGSSHPHLLARRPSWGRGGHRGSRPGAGRGERRAFPAASSLPRESIFETQVGPKVGRRD